MLCLICGTAMTSNYEDYPYTASGLPHVTLHDVEIYRCPNCGESEVVIPQIERLHRAIATTLIRKPTRLAADEVRFLRKYLGWSGVDFARHIGTTPETVSRWEQGKKAIGPVADRLLRLLVVTQVPVSDYSPDLLLKIVGTREPQPIPLDFHVDHQEWYEAALVGV